jgi:hypothetical protein
VNQIPARINGYNIIAQVPEFRLPAGDHAFWYPSTQYAVILGHDPSRRYEKYAVATIDRSTDMKQWVSSGFYTDDLPRALLILASRSHLDIVTDEVTD